MCDVRLLAGCIYVRWNEGVRGKTNNFILKSVRELFTTLKCKTFLVRFCWFPIKFPKAFKVFDLKSRSVWCIDEFYWYGVFCVLRKFSSELICIGGIRYMPCIWYYIRKDCNTHVYFDINVNLRGFLPLPSCSINPHYVTLVAKRFFFTNVQEKQPESLSEISDREYFRGDRISVGRGSDVISQSEK